MKIITEKSCLRFLEVKSKSLITKEIIKSLSQSIYHDKFNCKDLPIGIIFCHTDLVKKVKSNKFLKYLKENILNDLIIIESQIIPKHLFCNEGSTTFPFIVVKKINYKPNFKFYCHRTKTYKHHGVLKIISGGQTGADQGGLKAGNLMGLITGGYAPKNYATEDGLNYDLKDIFNLIETVSAGYKFRTFKNIIESDATVIFGRISSPGSKLTKNMAFVNDKSVFLVQYPENVNKYKLDFLKWLAENNVKTLNVAGNRESVNKGICKLAMYFLIECLANDKEVIKIAKYLLSNGDVK